MFESVVASVLNRILGHVELNGLALKREALDELDLPIEVVRGVVGELQLDIPWTNLKGRPVIITLNGVFVQARPVDRIDWERFIERQLKDKLDRLATSELLRASASRVPIKNDQQAESFTTNLVNKIIDNLQVSVKNIHVRFEYIDRSFSLGLCLSRLRAYSVDQDGIERFISETKNEIFKASELHGLCIYTDNEYLDWNDMNNWMAAMANVIENDDKTFIVRPVNGSGTACIQRRPVKGKPRVLGTVNIDEFGVVLEEDHFLDILLVLQRFILLARRQYHLQNRPTASCVQCPKEWLFFVFKSTLTQIRGESYCRTMECIMERGKTRREYIELYKSKIAGKMGNLERNRLDELDKQLPYQDIRMYRMIARRNMSSQSSSPVQSSASQKPSSTWWSYLWGSSSTNGSSIAEPNAEEVKELLETIDYDEESCGIDDLSFVNSKIDLSLKLGKLALVDAEKNTVIEVLVKAFLLCLMKRPRSKRFEISLGDLSVREGITRAEHFQQLLKSKANKYCEDDTNQEDGKFLESSFDSLTTSNTFSSSLKLRMKPLEIIINHEAAKKLSEYVLSGERGSALRSLSETAANKIVQLKAKTLANLQFALSNHQSTELDVFIEAPLVYLPLGCGRNDLPMFVLDLGCIDISSKPMPMASRRELIEKYRHASIEGESDELFDVLYDQSLVKLISTKLFYFKDFSQWNDYYKAIERTELESKNLVLDSMNLDLIVGTSIVKRVEGLIETQVRGNLPPFSLQFGDQKWKAFMLLVDFLLGKKTVNQPPNLVVPESPELEQDEGFYDAIEEEEEEEQPLSNKTSKEAWNKCRLSVNVTFEKVSALVNKYNHDSDSESLVATIVADKLSLCANIYPKNIHVNAVLEQFGLYDNRRHAQFEGPIIEGKAGSDFCLLKIIVDYVDDDHPLLYSKYSGAKIHIDVDVSDVLMCIEPENLFTHLRYVVDTFSEDDLALMEKLSISGDSESNVDDSGDVPSLVKIQASVCEASFALGRDDKYIGDLIARVAQFNIFVDRKRDITLEGSLHTIDIINAKPIPSELLDGRHFVSNNGEGNLASFTFQTFSKDAVDFDGIDSSLSLSAGSLKITYMPIFVNKLLCFVNLLKSSMTIVTKKQGNSESRMKVALQLESPVIELVREPRANIFRPVLVYLGNMHLENQFDRHITHQAIKIEGFRIVALKGPDLQPSNVLDDTNIDISIEQNSKALELKQPSNIVRGLIGDLKFSFGRIEYNLFMSRIYHFLDTISPAVEPWFASANTNSTPTAQNHINHDIEVTIPSISVSLYKESDEKQCFASLLISSCLIEMKMNNDNSMDLQLFGRDVSLEDPRNPEALFKLIIPPLQDEAQTRLNLKYYKDNQGFGTLKVELEALEIIFALNYVFALKAYLIDNLPPRSDYIPFDPEAKPLFQIYELKNLKLFLVEDSQSASSEALCLSIDNLSFSSRDNASVIIDNLVGSFINMDKQMDTELQLIEPVDINCSIEYEKVRGIAVKTTYNLAFDQFIARLSTEDYLFAQSIWTQFMSNCDVSSYIENDVLDEVVLGNTIDCSSIPRIGREKLLICCNLIRVVAIDDLSKVNLPLFDISVEKMEFELLDWSADTGINMTFQLFSNSFNLNNSHWEPLLEPTCFHIVSKTSGSPPKKDIVVTAEKKIDFVLTHFFVNSIYKLWSQVNQGDQLSAVSLKTADRQVAKPYRIFNFTGYPLAVWNEAELDPNLVTIEPNADIPWSFEDWRSSRRFLLNQSAKLSMQLLGSEWESLKGISIDKIGFFIFNLRPQLNNVYHKLSCEVTLVGSIKYVFIRPSVVLRNRTKFPLMAISDNLVDGQSAAIDIAPNGYSAFPIKYSHGCSFRLKPSNMEYELTTGSVIVSSLIRSTADDDGGGGNKKIAVQVKSISSIPEVAPFYFLVYSKSLSTRFSQEFLAANLIIRAPIELHNLLPYDIKFRMYDLDAKYDFGGSVSAGKVAPLHAIRSDHLVGLSIEIDGTDWRSAEVASMNCADRDFHDDEMRLRTPSGNTLNLRMLLEKDRGSARTVKIYCPYIIFNQTGLDVDIVESRGLDVSHSPDSVKNVFSSRMAAGKTSEPTLFSFSSHRSTRRRVRLRINGSHWSDTLSIDAIGTITIANLKHQDGNSWINVSVVSKLGSDRYSGTKMVYICPAYIIVNKLEKSLWIRAGTSDSVKPMCISADDNTPFHFDPDMMKKIQLRTLNSSPWTAFLDFSSVGKSFCRCQEPAGEKLLKVELSLDNGTCFVFVEESRSWPFAIDNQSDYPLSFNQTNVDVIREVPARSSIHFAWDEPTNRQRTIEIAIQGRKKEININEIGQRPLFAFRLSDNTKKHVSIDVVANGPMIKVKVGNHESEVSSRREKKSHNSHKLNHAGSSSPAPSRIESENTESEGFELAEMVEEVYMITVVKLPFVGLSVVRKDNKELLYLSCRDISIRLSRSNMYVTYGLQIKSIQLDNQMFDWQIPIILFPAYSPVHGNAQQKLEQQQQQQQQNHLQVALIKSTDATHGIDCYSYFGFLIQETMVELGTDIIVRLNEFMSLELPKASGLQRLVIDEAMLSLPKPPIRDRSKGSVYFELFQIHPIKLTATFTPTEGFVQDFEDRGGRYSNPFFALQEAAMSTFSNFSQAPLTFNALILEHPIVSLSRLKQLIYDHYVGGISGQMAKMIFSGDFIFNPVGLFNNLGSGVSDLFYEPYLGFVSDRPQDIGIGFLKGGISLVRKTVFGVTDSFSKFTGSIGKGLSALTFDKSFQQRRRLDRARNRPRHALFGVVAGTRQLIEGVAGGIGGLVEKPLEGAKEKGAEGFFKGIAVGIAGALSKPFVGAVDMVTSVTEGIRNSTDPNIQDLQQIRLPRVIPFDGIVRKYREREARGQSLLYNCIGADLFREFYMGHLEDEEGSALFITCRRILAGRIQSGRIIWAALFEQIFSIRTDSEAIIVTLKNTSTSSSDGHKQRRISCSRREVQEWFVERINLAMAVCNERNR